MTWLGHENGCQIQSGQPCDCRLPGEDPCVCSAISSRVIPHPECPLHGEDVDLSESPPEPRYLETLSDGDGDLG